MIGSLYSAGLITGISRKKEKKKTRYIILAENELQYGRKLLAQKKVLVASKLVTHAESVINCANYYIS